MNKVKAFFITVGSLLFNWLGILAIPWVLLLGLNIADYATGIGAAPYRNKEDDKPVKSYKSIRGIQKKVCMHLLIVIGWVIDVLIKNTLLQAGFQFKFPPIFAVTISCWLIFNELISILENVEDIGTPMPPFLMPIVKLIRKKINISVEENENEKRN